jgi:hypothetical protein
MWFRNVLDFSYVSKLVVTNIKQGVRVNNRDTTRSNKDHKMNVIDGCGCGMNTHRMTMSKCEHANNNKN